MNDYHSNKMVELEGQVVTLRIPPSAFTKRNIKAVYIENADGELCSVAHRFASEEITHLDGRKEIGYYKIDDSGIIGVDKEKRIITCTELETEPPHRDNNKNMISIFEAAKSKLESKE